ncbi:hypothetical protein GCM10027020_08590 [Nocardioides salsibiostraticola]
MISASTDNGLSLSEDGLTMVLGAVPDGDVSRTAFDLEVWHGHPDGRCHGASQVPIGSGVLRSTVNTATSGSRV